VDHRVSDGGDRLRGYGGGARDGQLLPHDNEVAGQPIGLFDGLHRGAKSSGNGVKGVSPTDDVGDALGGDGRCCWGRRRRRGPRGADHQPAEVAGGCGRRLRGNGSRPQCGRGGGVWSLLRQPAA
jgi:hypothetical protein